MKKILLPILLLELCFCKTIYKWKLDIKDQEGKNKIELTPGKFTKIYFELTSATDLAFPFLSEDSYVLSFDDNNIISLDKYIILTPRENLVYSTYIGLNCENLISGDSYQVNIKVIPNNEQTEEETIEYKEIDVLINKKEIKIDLDILFYSMPKSSFNLFKLKEEPYNINEISIKADKIEGFEFEDIVIKPFNEREQLDEKNSVNHGIIFDSSFGLTNPDLSERSFSLKINLVDDKLKQCYKLSKEEFKFNIEKEIPKIDERLKKVIKFSFEDITEKYDNTTNFKIKTIIPEAPIMLTCFLKQKLIVYSKNQKEQQNLKYKNIITQSGDFIIEVNNLEFNSEYFANCEFSDTNYEDNQRNKININIGNKDNYDIIHQLKTTRESKRIPQCIELMFDQKKISEFKELGSLICKYFMKKDEPFKIRDLPTIVCEIVETNEENATVCVSPSPKFNIEEYTKISNNYNFNASFNNFIEHVKKIYFAKIIGGIEYDLNLDNSIYTYISGIQTRTTGKYRNTTYYLRIISIHSQKVQCFYNSEFTEKDSKSTNYDSSMILSPNNLDLFISFHLWKEIYTFYNLNLICYSLPNFNYKYESHDFGNIFTYYNTEKNKYYYNGETDNGFNFNNNTINCNEKKNKINPICLENEKIPINRIIKTDLPEFLKEVDIKINLFSKTTEPIKFYYLNKFYKNYTNEINFETKNVKEFLEKSIEILKYLSHINCTRASELEEDIRGIEPNYTNCRSMKQEYMMPIINTLDTIISMANNNNINLILSNIGGKDLEENLKYILIFLKELTNNEDSYSDGWILTVTDFVIMLQEKYDEYWPKVYEQLNNNKNYLVYIEEVEKEVLLSIFEILTSIPRIIHYNEIDGYLNNTKENMTKTGLIINDISIKVQNAIVNFSKKMNKLDINSNNNGYFENILATSAEEKKTFEISKDINLEMDSKSLLSTKEAYSLQIFTFDSPLVTLYPQENPKESYNTLNNFISITLLNEEGKEIKIENINKKNRPKILYAKDKYEGLKGCYYYDENKHILKTDGMSFDDNYVYNNKNYYKCEPSHLSMFTAGTNKHADNVENEDKSYFAAWKITVIIFAVLIALIVAIIIIIHLKKRKINNNTIDSSFGKNEGLMKEELS